MLFQSISEKKSELDINEIGIKQVIIFAPARCGQSFISPRAIFKNLFVEHASKISRNVSQKEWAIKLLNSDTESRLPRGYLRIVEKIAGMSNILVK
jgi:hypothetical protein